MLPSAALMPPCAATVWLRVGNTLVMQAVDSPASARPSVARRPAPPAPDHDHVVGVIDEFVGAHAAAPQRDAQHRIDAAGGQQHVQRKPTTAAACVLDREPCT